MIDQAQALIRELSIVWLALTLTRQTPGALLECGVASARPKLLTAGTLSCN